MTGFEYVKKIGGYWYGYCEYTGYDPKTTFFDDFSIAEIYGVDAIQDTFNRAQPWISSETFSAELTLVLNLKCNLFFEFLENGNKEYFGAKKCAELYELYYKLFYEWHNKCLNEYSKKGNEAKLEYYYDTTD